MTVEGRGHPEHERALTLLNALAVAFTTSRLYPNPADQPAFARARDLIGSGLESPEVRIRLARDRVLVGGHILDPPTEAAGRLTEALFERGVLELHVRSVPDADELIAFSSLAVEDPSSVEAAGGASAYLAARGVLSIGVSDRRLEVAFEPDRRHEALLRGGLRALLMDQAALAQELDADGVAEDVYDRLRDLIGEGTGLGLDAVDLSMGLGDTIGAISGSLRARLLEIAIRRLPDPFAMSVMGQLSDTEITHALAALAADRGAELALLYAAQVVERSGGRSEVPVRVAGDLIDAEFDRESILRVFGTLPLLGEAQRHVLDNLALLGTAGADEATLAELRLEAEQLAGAERNEAMALLGLLLSSSETADESFEALAAEAERSLRARTAAGEAGQVLAVLEVVRQAADSHPRSERRLRLEQVLEIGASDEVLTALLGDPEDAPAAVRRLAPILRERTIPALVTRLAAEDDALHRKVLMDLLAEVQWADLSPLLASLDDPRWYLVRNLATVLGRLERPEAAPALLRLARHAEPRVRREALRSLTAAGSSSATLRVLASALDDPERGVRSTAIAALGAVPDPDAGLMLMELSQTRSHPLRERKLALTSLRLQGTEAARRFLERVARRRWPPTHSSRELARHARELLERMPAASDET